MAETTREDLLQELALKLDLANMELQTIDNVLARRPALAHLRHRTEKIERACQAAADADKALCDICHLAIIHVPRLIAIEDLASAAIKRLRAEETSNG